jgi:hypothetical protein
MIVTVVRMLDSTELMWILTTDIAVFCGYTTSCPACRSVPLQLWEYLGLGIPVFKIARVYKSNTVHDDLMCILLLQ